MISSLFRPHFWVVLITQQMASVKYSNYWSSHYSRYPNLLLPDEVKFDETEKYHGKSLITDFEAMVLSNSKYVYNHRAKFRRRYYLLFLFSLLRNRFDLDSWVQDLIAWMKRALHKWKGNVVGKLEGISQLKCLSNSKALPKSAWLRVLQGNRIL